MGLHENIFTRSRLPLLFLATAHLILPATTRAQRPEPPFFQSVAWSPDGARLVTAAVLESWDDGFRLYVLKLDGSGLQEIPIGGERALYPAYAPDGRRIAFGMTDGERQSIWIADADGTHAVRLTEGRDRAGGPDWSPEGSRIAYHADLEGKRQVFVINADGTGRRRVSPGPGNNFNPRWSPDGSMIAYYSDRRGGGAHDTIYVVSIEGVDERKVTGGVFPTWTPDGRLVFADRAGEEMALFVVDSAGTGRRKLTDRAVYGAASPDGRRLAVVAYVDPPDGPVRYRIDLIDCRSGERRALFP